MRSNRLPAIVFAIAVVLMLAAASWVVFAWWSGQDVPAIASQPPPIRTRTAEYTGASPAAPATASKQPSTRSNRIPLRQPLAAADAVAGEALLCFRTPEALTAFLGRARALGIEVLSHDERLHAVRVRLRDESGLERDLAAHAEEYASVGPNFFVRVPAPPPAGAESAVGREPFRSQGLEMIGAATERSQWGRGVTVAVIDSGISAHPSLQNVPITHIDLVNDGSALNGHGTAMASLIAGNATGVSGVAPAAKLLDIRVANTEGESHSALLSSGIVRAVDLGARVINISLGAQNTAPMLTAAVNYALSHHAVIVAAAGNDHLGALSMPAGLPGVLSVGAVDADGTPAWFTNSGGGLTLVAPGVGIVSGYSGGRLVIGSGTSQATAITSGVVASLLSRGYYPQNIIPLLTGSARALSASASAVGAGLLQVPK